MNKYYVSFKGQNVQVDAAFEQVRVAIVKATGTEGEGAK